MTGIATRADIARLFGRAAFGATLADLQTWEGRPYVEAVDHLLAVPSLEARPLALDEPNRLLLASPNLAIERGQRWWLERMRTTAYPLEERLTLLWHDHFATSWQGDFPDTAMMMRQNQLLRRYALGSFRTLAEQIILDPAMLYWLDGVQNTAASKNENFAREFFELFTLGVRPQLFTEWDIREATRVFTGWVVDANTGEPRFVAGRHDNGTKVVLGRTITNKGATEYLEVAAAAFAQPLTQRFIAAKLVNAFVSAVDSEDLLLDPPPLVVAVADALGASWDVRAAMRLILLSPEFRTPNLAAGEGVIRSPIELVVHLGKVLGVSLDAAGVVPMLARMSQKPLEPPNVGGWPDGEHWLTTSTVLARYDWGLTAYGLWAAVPAQLRRALPPANDIDGWVALFGLAGINPNTRAAIADYLLKRATAPETERQTGVLVLLASSPDWGVL